MKKDLLIILIALPFFAISQTFVSTTPENKNVILEEFTGITCVYCPDGHRIAQDLHNANPNDVFLINIHTGGYASPQGPGTDFNTSFGAAIAGQSGLSGYPAGTVNRHVFSGGATAMSRSLWASSATQMMSQASPVNVGVQYSIYMSTNTMTVNVEVYYTGAQTVLSKRLNVAVVQNNVEGPQTGGSQFNAAQILPNGNYNHQHMLRHMLTGQWGDIISNISPGTTYSNSYTWNIPNQITGYPLSPVVDPVNLAVVAFVSEGQQEILSGTELYPSIIFPNSYDAYFMSVTANDVVCSNSNDLEVTFRNYGNQNLTSLDIEYSIGSGPTLTYNWTGNLAPAGTETVTIPSVAFTPGTSNIVNVNLTNPNGNVDQNTANNSGVTSFSHMTTLNMVSTGHASGNCTFDVTTDQYGSETTWEIIDDYGNVVASGGPYSSQGTQPTQTISLANECYSLYFYDSYGDGIYAPGGYELKDASGNVIHANWNFTGSLDRDVFEMGSAPPPASYNCVSPGNCQDPGDGSGQYASMTQCMMACVSTDITENRLDVNLFPNPAFKTLNVEGDFERIEIFNLIGELVISTSSSTIDVSALEGGIYYSHILKDQDILIKQITITK